MLVENLQRILERVHGVTFASLDARTKNGGCVIETTGEQVMLFNMKKGSGYENKVNRELRKRGFVGNFRCSDLPWGERIGTLPLIQHRGFYYLQTILLRSGLKRYSIGGVECSKPSWLEAREDKLVLVHTYNIENILKLKLLKEELHA